MSGTYFSTRLYLAEVISSACTCEVLTIHEVDNLKGVYLQACQETMPEITVSTGLFFSIFKNALLRLFYLYI